MIRRDVVFFMVLDLQENWNSEGISPGPPSRNEKGCAERCEEIRACVSRGRGWPGSPEAGGESRRSRNSREGLRPGSGDGHLLGGEGRDRGGSELAELEASGLTARELRSFEGLDAGRNEAEACEAAVRRARLPRTGETSRRRILAVRPAPDSIETTGTGKATGRPGLAAAGSRTGTRRGHPGHRAESQEGPSTESLPGQLGDHEKKGDRRRLHGASFPEGSPGSSRNGRNGGRSARTPASRTRTASPSFPVLPGGRERLSRGSATRS